MIDRSPVHASMHAPAPYRTQQQFIYDASVMYLQFCAVFALFFRTGSGSGSAKRTPDSANSSRFFEFFIVLTMHQFITDDG